MDGSNVSILQLLKEKSNILNRKCQEFQVNIKNVMNEMMESQQINNENKSKFKNKINELLDDHSLSINRLEIQYLTKCEKCLQHQIKHEIDNESSKSSNTEKSKPYKCEQCNISYTASTSLRRHNRKTHQNEPEYSTETEENESSKSGAYTANSSLSRYNEEYKENSISIESKPYSCSECDRTYTMKKHLLRHIRNAHNGYPYPCKLNECNQKFKYHSELKAHQNSVHTLNTNNCNTDQDIKSDDNDDKDIDLEIEHISDKTNNDRYCNPSTKLKEHHNSVDILNTNNCNTEKDIKLDDINDRYCNLCNKEFTASSSLKEHELTVHSDERPYECSQCDKTFKLKKYVFAHIRNTHKGNPFHCTFTGCNEKFKYHAELAQHKKSKHKQNESSIPATIRTIKKRKLIETELNEETDRNSNNNKAQIDAHDNPQKKRKLNEDTHHNNSSKKKTYSPMDDTSTDNNDNSIKSTPYSQQQRRNKRRLYISDTDSDTESDDDNMDDMNRNNQEKQFECNVCFKSFKNAAGLGGHRRHCKETKYDEINWQQNDMNTNMNESKQESLIPNNSKEELNESENEELKLLPDIPDLEETEDDDMNKIEIKALTGNRTKSLFNHRL